MSKRSDEILIEDILVFISSGMAADAVIRNLEIIGEAANRLSEEYTARHPEIEWRKIVGLRHRIVHEDDHLRPFRFALFFKSIPITITSSAFGNFGEICCQ